MCNQAPCNHGDLVADSCCAEHCPVCQVWRGLPEDSPYSLVPRVLSPARKAAISGAEDIHHPSTIAEMYRDACASGDSGDSGACIAYADVAKRAKAMADEAWNALVRAELGGIESVASYQRGRAHALCELMGDQSALSRMGAFD